MFSVNLFCYSKKQSSHYQDNKANLGPTNQSLSKTMINIKTWHKTRFNQALQSQ